MTEQNKEPIEQQQEQKTFTQEQVDKIVQERALREVRSKYGDYDLLKEKVTKFEQAMSEKEQKALEESKDYAKAKENYEAKLKEFQTIIANKDGSIKDMTINNSLLGEITKQGAYTEEALALLKTRADLTQEGTVVIKSKDANGIDTSLSVEAGVKAFLSERPHLVKANQREGSGSSGGNPDLSSGQGEDLASLSNKLNEARARGDIKLQGELKAKISKLLPARVM